MIFKWDPADNGNRLPLQVPGEKRMTLSASVNPALRYDPTFPGELHVIRCGGEPVLKGVGTAAAHSLGY